MGPPSSAAWPSVPENGMTGTLDSELDRMEEELKARINQLGIGPGSVGGKTTALAVKIGMAYTHTAICPVAVNFHCWVGRRSVSGSLPMEQRRKFYE